MSRRSVVSMLGAAALLAASVAGASSAFGPPSGRDGAVEPELRRGRGLRHRGTHHHGHGDRWPGHLRWRAHHRALQRLRSTRPRTTRCCPECSDATVLAEQTCSVTVSFNPFAAGQRTGHPQRRGDLAGQRGDRGPDRHRRAERHRYVLRPGAAAARPRHPGPRWDVPAGGCRGHRVGAGRQPVRHPLHRRVRRGGQPHRHRHHLEGLLPAYPSIKPRPTERHRSTSQGSDRRQHGHRPGRDGRQGKCTTTAASAHPRRRDGLVRQGRQRANGAINKGMGSQFLSAG